MAEPAQAPKLPREVAVRAPDGTIGTVARKDLAQALSAGAEQVSGEEFSKAKLEAEYGGLGGGAKAAGLGFLRGATLGLSDVVATGGNAFGDAKANRKALAGYQEANPLASTGGELAGVVAPSLLTGGIATPAGAVSAVGSAVERGVAKGAAGLLGEGLLSKGVGMAAQGAVEGGLFGGASAISEAAIQDHDLTAEHVLASAGKGALFGGAIGGGLGLAGGGLRRAGDAVGDLAGLLGGAEGEAGTLASKAQGLAERSAFDAAGPMLKDFRKLAKYGVEPEKLGRFMLDELPQVSGKSFATMSREEIASAASKVADSYGAKIGEAIDAIDAAAVSKGVGADAGAVFRRAYSEVLEPLSKLPGYEGVQAKVGRYLESFGEKTGILTRDANGAIVDAGTKGNVSFKELKRFREGLDDLIFRGNKALSDEPIIQELRSVRGILEDEIGKQAKALGDEAVSEAYATAKQGYRNAKTVSDIAGDRVAREEANRAISLTDYITGAGFAAGNPLGFAMAGVNKVLRERGSQIAAGLLDKASRINALQSISTKFSGDAGAAVKGLLSAPRKVTTATVASGAGRTKATEKSIDQVTQMAANPAAIPARVNQLVDAGVAPSVAQSLAMKATTAITWLAAQAPRGTPVSPAIPTVTRPPSKLELMTFQRKLDVFEDPLGTLTRSVKRGELTLDHVQALEAMYPRVIEQFRADVLLQFGEMAQKGKLPPYERRIQLGTLLGVPLDPSQTQEFMASQQAVMEPQEPPPQPPAAMVGKPPKLAQQMETTTDRLESGDTP